MPIDSQRDGPSGSQRISLASAACAAARAASSRTGAIKSIIKINLAQPRDLTSEMFRDYERRIFADLAQSFALEGHLAM